LLLYIETFVVPILFLSHGWIPRKCASGGTNRPIVVLDSKIAEKYTWYRVFEDSWKQRWDDRIGWQDFDGG
jgi:hypothetical protein